jgi:outer membrane protein
MCLLLSAKFRADYAGVVTLFTAVPMNIFKKLLISSMLVSLAAPAYSGSLQEAMEAAYTNNPGLQAERARVKSANEQGSQARSGFLPSVTGSYAKGRENRESVSTNLFGRTTTNDVYSTTEQQQLSLTQPIFNGGNTYYSIKKADNTIGAAHADYYRTEQSVLLNTVEAYLNVAREQEVVELSRHNEEVLQKHLDVSRERFRLGEITKTDVSQAESRLAVSTTERVKAEGDLENARALFKKVTLITPNVGEIPAVPTDIPQTPDEIRSLALQANPALVSAIYTEKAAGNQIDVARSALMPVVSVQGNMRKEDGTVMSSAGEYTSKAVTLNVTVPIFESGVEYSRIRDAKRREEAARGDREDIYNAVEEYATRVWHNYDVAMATIESTKAAEDAAQVALEGVIQEAQVGSRTTLDVLDAEQELFSTRVSSVTARRDAVLAAYTIKSAIGRLTAKDLGLQVDLFDPEAYYADVKYQFIGY